MEAVTQMLDRLHQRGVTEIVYEVRASPQDGDEIGGEYSRHAGVLRKNEDNTYTILYTLPLEELDEVEPTGLQECTIPVVGFDYANLRSVHEYARKQTKAQLDLMRESVLDLAKAVREGAKQAGTGGKAGGEAGAAQAQPEGSSPPTQDPPQAPDNREPAVGPQPAQHEAGLRLPVAGVFEGRRGGSGAGDDPRPEAAVRDIEQGDPPEHVGRPRAGGC